MSERVNRREQILDTAGKLFMEHGYEGTSVRQIAEQVGCTEAALYYHFKEGKRELLNCVVEHNMPDLLYVLDGIEEATSLRELIMIFGERITINWSQRMERLRWVMSEFPRWSDDERALFHDKHRLLEEGLVGAIERFVDSREAAHRIAYTLMCAFFGYGSLFLNLDLQSVVDFDPTTLTEMLAVALASGR
ncbi:MAG: TetR/AcrR family transcriptional regulator [Chloroflexi bacterium]|nr:MAG: hypothetical protein CUN54_01180 [Phototrophicales bacterium]RMF82388.1 MAG: TetR/AcrR family transcriptional regulator [Chloroflexota bacterium]